jgi:hypothetical protein
MVEGTIIWCWRLAQTSRLRERGLERQWSESQDGKERKSGGEAGEGHVDQGLALL